MWINVKDFSPPTPPGNALGDGTNDDTAAIQLAIDYAQAAATPDKRGTKTGRVQYRLLTRRQLDPSRLCPRPVCAPLS